jgi:hypothetical protein
MLNETHLEEQIKRNITQDREQYRQPASEIVNDLNPITSSKTPKCAMVSNVGLGHRIERVFICLSQQQTAHITFAKELHCSEEWRRLGGFTDEMSVPTGSNQKEPLSRFAAE